MPKYSKKRKYGRRTKKYTSRRRNTMGYKRTYNKKGFRSSYRKRSLGPKLFRTLNPRLAYTKLHWREDRVITLPSGFNRWDTTFNIFDMYEVTYGNLHQPYGFD